MARNTKIKDIEIKRSGGRNQEQEQKYFVVGGMEFCIPKNRDAIALYADEPCLEACQLLYDLNIQTYTSGGHVDGRENAEGKAYIGIVYDTLSESNKEVANTLIKQGIIDDHHQNEGRGSGRTISLDVSIHSDSLVGEISDRLVQLANFFHQQDVLYGRKNVGDLQSEICIKVSEHQYRDIFTFEIISEEEMQQALQLKKDSMFTSDGEIYFVSEDLLNKHVDYINNYGSKKK